MIVNLYQVLRHYLNHPLGRRDKPGTLGRFVRWQFGSRLLGEAVAMPFAENLRLLARTGTDSATGNFYVGLMDFEEMAFVLHFIRKNDRFIDVGANIGTYSLLAASRGANVIAVEPVADSYERLVENIKLNRMDKQIDARRIGVSRERDILRFSTQFDSINYVLKEDEDSTDFTSVAVDKLDVIAANFSPSLLKIDVEGYETEVISGAHSVLSSESLLAIIIELNGLGQRYENTDQAIHRQLLDHCFIPAHYDPFNRNLQQLTTHNSTGNTLYVRSFDSVCQRLLRARAIACNGISI
jgi:FkbM family methyltransferase